MSQRAKATSNSPPVPLQEVAYARLRADITNGQVSPGVSLQEEELSRRLGISRTPLREAIRRLAEEGLVEVVPYRGARVVNLDGNRLEDLFEVREAIEGMAARLAAARMTKREVEKSRRSLKVRLREVGRRPSRYRPPALDFHQQVLRACGNRLLIDLARRLYAQMSLARAASGAFRERAADAAREHLAILDAVGKRDGETAERLMRQHIRRSRENLLRYLKEIHREQVGIWTA